MQDRLLVNRNLRLFSLHIFLILVLLLSNSMNITFTLKQENQMITEASGSATGIQMRNARDIVGWDVLITSQEQWGSNNYEVYSGNSYAQSFHTNVDCNLSKVCFYGRKRGTPSGTVTVKIMTDDEGKPSGIILENGTITVSIRTLPQWYEAIVDPTIFLEANITYWIVLEANLNFNQRFQWFYYDVNDIYPDGNTASDTGSGWQGLFQSDPLIDCTFKLYEKVKSDNVAPTCEIINPSDGQVIDKTTQIEVNAVDDICIAHVDFFIDNQLVYIDTNAPYTYSWDTTSIFYGVCIINAIAYDIANNTASAIPITVTVNQTVTPLKNTQRYAVIVGVSDYEVADDLSYCDEDVTDWYNYLREVFYIQSNHVWILGDNHPENYPKYDGLATETETKAKLSQMISLADSDDEIFFLTSGHGTGDDYGNSILCMWDYGSGEGGEDGALRDYELASIFSSANAKNIFIFLDHC
ncbi:MAG: Ig-like domain-containing protein, partial [Promethearchaeota archaeon]